MGIVGSRRIKRLHELNVEETGAKLAELVEDVIEHKAAVIVVCRLKCARAPVDELSVELEVGVDNCKCNLINHEKVQESK